MTKGTATAKTGAASPTGAGGLAPPCLPARPQPLVNPTTAPNTYGCGALVEWGRSRCQTFTWYRAETAGRSRSTDESATASQLKKKRSERAGSWPNRRTGTSHPRQGGSNPREGFARERPPRHPGLNVLDTFGIQVR
jgi:hypothetical protein